MCVFVCKITADFWEVAAKSQIMANLLIYMSLSIE